MFGKKKNKSIWSQILKTLMFSFFSKPLLEKLTESAFVFTAYLKNEANAYLRLAIELMIVALLAMVGVVFLLAGLAQYLESVSNLPGAGLLYVGCGILIATLVFYLAVKQKFSK